MLVNDRPIDDKISDQPLDDRVSDQQILLDIDPPPEIEDPVQSTWVINADMTELEKIAVEMVNAASANAESNQESLVLAEPLSFDYEREYSVDLSAENLGLRFAHHEYEDGRKQHRR